MNLHGAYDLLRQIGCRIKQLRIQRAISQGQLASMCHIHKSSMSDIEAGKINVTMHTLFCIVGVFDISMGDFLEGLD